MDMLSSKGVRPSAQRILILSHLAYNRTHPTVDDIYNSLHPNHPTLSRTTVYNTLKLLSAAGLIRAIAFENGESTHWDFSEHPHAHFLCVRCGSLTDINLSLPGLPPLPTGYVVTEIGVTFKGLCPSCPSAE